MEGCQTWFKIRVTVSPKPVIVSCDITTMCLAPPPAPTPLASAAHLLHRPLLSRPSFPHYLLTAQYPYKDSRPLCVNHRMGFAPLALPLAMGRSFSGELPAMKLTIKGTFRHVISSKEEMTWLKIITY